MTFTLPVDFDDLDVDGGETFSESALAFKSKAVKVEQMTLDLEFVRAQYPVFVNPDTGRWAMFENAGGS